MTAKILNLIRYEKSPTPMYKFKEFKQKIALINKYKNNKNTKVQVKKDSLILGPTKKIKGKAGAVSFRYASFRKISENFVQSLNIIFYL